MTALLVIIGAMIGAPARYLVDRAVLARFANFGPWKSGLPLGTLTVNIVGSAILGGLVGAGAGHGLSALAGTGFCGALTTFSTFGYDTIRLTVERAYFAAIGYVVISVAASLTAVYLTASAAQRVWS